MSETMENAALNSGEIADRTPAAKAEETKADKFIRLGEYRMNKAIDAIGRIENLANRSAYEYTPEQVEAMFSVLESKVAEVKAKFTVTKLRRRISGMNTAVYSTGDKILNVMKEMDMSIPGLAELSGIHENTLLNILAGIKEPDIGTACRIADALGICVRELCPDEEQYAVFIKKDTLAKLIVISEINGVEPDELIASILEKGIEENGFYD